MTAASPVIRVFEPALCCNTGVCGPDLDQALVTFTADLEHLQGLGVDIQRHNLANDPAAFATDSAVRDFLRVAGSAGLPLTLVDGITVLTGGYPSRARLLELAGRSDVAAPTTAPTTEPATPEPATPEPAAPAHRDLGLSAVSSGGCCGGGTSAAEQPVSSSCCGGATPSAAVGTTTAGACC